MDHNNIQSEYWDKEADRIASINEEMSDLAKKEIEDFLNLIKLSSGSKVLEIGCGAGRFTLPLLQKGYYVTGTEISEKSLEKLRQYSEKENLQERLTLRATDFLEPTFNNEFDLVFIGNVIHHFDPQKKQQIVNNIIKALKSGGQVAIWEPNAYCPFFLPWYLFLELSGKEKGVWRAEKGVFSSSYSEIKNLLENAGLENISLKRHTFIPLRAGKFIKSVDKINNLILRLPFLKNLSAYLWIFGNKK